MTVMLLEGTACSLQFIFRLHSSACEHVSISGHVSRTTKVWYAKKMKVKVKLVLYMFVAALLHLMVQGSRQVVATFCSNLSAYSCTCHRETWSSSMQFDAMRMPRVYC